MCSIRVAEEGVFVQSRGILLVGSAGDDLKPNYSDYALMISVPRHPHTERSEAVSNGGDSMTLYVCGCADSRPTEMGCLTVTSPRIR